MSGENGGIIVQKITYLRQVKPPSLNQFIWRKALKAAASQTVGMEGTEINPSTGNLNPSAAVKIKNKLAVVTVSPLINEHPEWVQEYRAKYGVLERVVRQDPSKK